MIAVLFVLAALAVVVIGSILTVLELRGQPRPALTRYVAPLRRPTPKRRATRADRRAALIAGINLGDQP